MLKVTSRGSPQTNGTSFVGLHVLCYRNKSSNANLINLVDYSVQLLAGGELPEKHYQILEQYRSKAEYYVCACLDKNNGSNVDRTPGGMLYIRQWNNMQYVSSAAYLLAIYSDYLTELHRELHCPDGIVEPGELLGLAKSQADYILGSNPMGISYLVGYGPRYPRHVHHRGASTVSYKQSKGFIGCTQGYDDWYQRRVANPNVLVGALVGGPDSQDNFRDDRGNYMQTEACTYNTAPLVGVFARLHRLASQHIQESSPRTSFSY